jgi:cystathionine beta-lyase
VDERTRLIRNATRRGGPRRPVNPPVERATTLLNAKAEDLRDETAGPVYGIDGMAVHRTLEAALADLERAEGVALVPTGLAAVTTALLALLRPGDEVLATDGCYGPTRRFMERRLPRLGMRARYHSPRATAAEAAALIGPATRVLFIESPSTATFEVQDTPALIAMAAERGVATVVDNTWAAGMLFRPLDHGATVTLQALSKYAGGHSDVFMGAIAWRDEAAGRKVRTLIEDLGSFVSPDDAYLVLRGLRTLPLRLAQHGEAALHVAQWLERRPEVARVLYPALPSSPDHALWRRDFSGASGLLGLVLKPGSTQAAQAMLNALELFGLGFSWGGFESLATFEGPQLAVRAAPEAIEGPLIRLHVGLEAPEDLIADLGRGLDVYAAMM